MNERIDQFLASQLNQLKIHNSGRLIAAMEYTLLNGGKRMRPKLVYATAESIGLDLSVADHIAAAIEMIHAYSLIHDDLPAMDDDDLRRGQATCHIKFDEATAILAADALQTLAFECLSQTTINSSTIVKLIQNLAKAAGAPGMVGGQMLDLEAEDKTLNIDELQEIHSKKTGALLQSCVTMVTDCDDSMNQDKRKHFKAFAEHFGIAYQIIDDVLDVSSDTETLGKPAQSDLKNNKSTYPSLLGLDQARNKAKDHIDVAASHLASISHSSELSQLLQLVAKRTF
ncbi:polyprenyl synthetase family protein [Marinicella sp. S1101]|uniref:polyprenyl synthetase family protein n=1 Tax=Marinicella marina TaxID=2996016 RepID=UPI0022608953|nr:farnesyl diphosphate synthase [Marinicella marina]MCX7554986.1 polyprenyl synthetase family protein [Marinicella marina]MDJ1141596.1 polyprenyl synthetase family protein [Marinicella marina]